MNTVPFSGEDSAEIVPPWASTIRRETERPSPVPPSLRVTNGSNKVSAMSEGIPHPLSRQRTMMVSSFRSADRKIDPSCPTASFALRSRFRNTCSSLTLSPVKSPMPDDILEDFRRFTIISGCRGCAEKVIYLPTDGSHRWNPATIIQRKKSNLSYCARNLRCM